MGVPIVRCRVLRLGGNWKCWIWRRLDSSGRSSSRDVSPYAQLSWGLLVRKSLPLGVQKRLRYQRGGGVYVATACGVASGDSSGRSRRCRLPGRQWVL
jgi:hypothetical protein